MAQIKQIVGEEFRRLQLLELDMLVELDRVCRLNGIRYAIGCGTLLGAVRHKGFIPWDDDVDVFMLREEYEKFRHVAKEMNQDICFFQDHTTDSDYRWGYGKLRRTGTKFVRVGQEHLKCKTGVFIDIFPLDDTPNSTIGKMCQDFHCFILRKLLWSEVGRFDVSASVVERCCYKLMSKIPIELVFRNLSSIQRNSSNGSPNEVRLLTFKSFGKLYRKRANPLAKRYSMPKQWFLSTCEYEFEGKRFAGIGDYDAFLTWMYGDWMTPPPENERDPHSPVSEYEF